MIPPPPPNNTDTREPIPRQKPWDRAVAPQAQVRKRHQTASFRTKHMRHKPRPNSAAALHSNKSSSRDRQARTSTQALRRRRCAPGPGQLWLNCAVAPPARATNLQRRLALLANKRGTSSQERPFHTSTKALDHAAVPQAQLRRSLSARSVQANPYTLPRPIPPAIHTIHSTGSQTRDIQKDHGYALFSSWYPFSQYVLHAQMLCPPDNTLDSRVDIQEPRPAVLQLGTACPASRTQVGERLRSLEFQIQNRPPEYSVAAAHLSRIAKLTTGTPPPHEASPALSIRQSDKKVQASHSVSTRTRDLQDAIPQSQ